MDQRLLGVLPQVGVLGGLDLQTARQFTACIVTVWPGLAGLVAVEMFV